VSGGLSTRRKRRRVNRDRDSLHAWLELTSADCLINIYIVHSTALCVSAVHQTTCDNSRFISIIINIKSQLLCANYSVYLFIQRERDMSVGIYHAKVSIKVPIIIPFPFPFAMDHPHPTSWGWGSSAVDDVDDDDDWAMARNDFVFIFIFWHSKLHNLLRVTNHEGSRWHSSNTEYRPNNCFA